MAIIESFSLAPVSCQISCSEAVHRAIVNLTELVDGPELGAQAQVIRDPILWTHRQFDLFRSALPDNDQRIAALARIEHDFIAALSALNFGDQRRQLRAALKAVSAFGGDT